MPDTLESLRAEVARLREKLEKLTSGWECIAGYIAEARAALSSPPPAPVCIYNDGKCPPEGSGGCGCPDKPSAPQCAECGGSGRVLNCNESQGGLYKPCTKCRRKE